MSQTVGETKFHQLLKRVAMRELQKVGYALHVEPSKPPFKRVSWEAYRPDLVGIKVTKNQIYFVLVECETTPVQQRVMKKTRRITRTLSLQKRLNEQHLFRLLLLIPSLTFEKINFIAIRRVWEIWIVNKKGGLTHKLPQMR